MRIFKRIFFGIYLVCVLLTPVFARDVSMHFSGSFLSYPAAPRLVAPLKEKVVLRGQDPLEFKWWNDFMSVDHLILRIYRGYAMTAQNLIYKETIPDSVSSVKVRSSLFLNGQVYTWSLIQVSYGGQKSDKSYSSFTVVKED